MESVTARESTAVGYVGDGKKSEAQAHADQELAALFYRSNWTQEELAKIEEKSRPYITQRLVFGRFLQDVAIATNPDFAPIQATLTEGKFRTFYALTSERDDDARAGGGVVA